MRASSSEGTPQDDPTSHEPQLQDKGLAQLFSDAASYGRILTSSPNPSQSDLVAEDGRSTKDSLDGFSQLVVRDLDDNERVVSEKFAQLAVSNWAPSRSRSSTLSTYVDLAESDESPSDEEHAEHAEHVLTAPPQGGEAQTPGVPDFEDKLTHDEILDLLQQEFGALAPPGEEKLIVESDAVLRSQLTPGGDAPYHASPRVQCVALVISTQP